MSATTLPSPCPLAACDEFGHHPYERGGERYHRRTRTAASIAVTAERTEYIDDDGALVVDPPVVVVHDADGKATRGEAWLTSPTDVEEVIQALREAAWAAWGEGVGGSPTRPSRPRALRGGAATGDKVLWTVREVSAVTGYAEDTVYKWARQGRLPSRRIGRNIRFVPREIEQWAERQKRGGR